jgi:hypothetical protein
MRLPEDARLKPVAFLIAHELDAPAWPTARHGGAS